MGSEMAGKFWGRGKRREVEMRGRGKKGIGEGVKSKLRKVRGLKRKGKRESEREWQKI